MLKVVAYEMITVLQRVIQRIGVSFGQETVQFFPKTVWFNTLQWLLGFMGNFEFLPSNELLSLAGQVLCNEKAITVDICEYSLFIFCGFDSAQLNKVNVKYQCSLRTSKSSNTAGRPGDVPCTVGMCGALVSVLTIVGK